MRSNVAIAGAGTTGAFLFRLLRNRGLKPDVFDLKHPTRCGLRPCAWGTSNGFVELVKLAGLDPERYILGRFDHLLMDDVKIRADLMTFDKPMLIRDLLEGAEVNYSPLDPHRYERVVDATGVARAFLPKIHEDIILDCIQSRIRTREFHENRIRLGSIGYAWCFPLSESEYHIGCGSLLADPRGIMEKLGWLGTAKFLDNKKLCGCAGKIRLTGPYYSQPFVTEGAHSIWGVGEAIGCVAPLAGDGIVPGMKSVRLLVENWDDPDQYKKAVLREFGWMRDERRVIDKLRRMERLGVIDVWVLKKNSRRMGMEIGFLEAAELMKNLR